MDALDCLQNCKALGVRDGFNRTPLHVAVMQNMADDVIRILRNSSYSTSVDRHGKTALHYACKIGNFDIVKLFFQGDYKVDFTAKDEMGCSALHVASGSIAASLRIVTKLMSVMTNHEVLIKDKHGKCALDYAWSSCMIKTLHMASLCAKKGHPQDFFCCSGYVHEGDIYIRENKWLNAAAMNDQERCMHLMNHTNKDESDGCNRTALHFAVRSDSIDIVNILLLNGANTSIADSFGKTALHYACENKSLNIIRTLLSSTRNIDDIDSMLSVVDSGGYSALHMSDNGCSIDEDIHKLVLQAVMRKNLNRIRHNRKMSRHDRPDEDVIEALMETMDANTPEMHETDDETSFLDELIFDNYQSE
jgi:ankyrin repeat protein